MITRTLRFRLAAWYALSLACVLAAMGTLVYVVVRHELVGHHDQALAAAADEVVRVLAQQADCVHLTPDQEAALDGIGHLVLFHEFEGEGRVFYRSPDAAGLPAPAHPGLALSPDPVTGWFDVVSLGKGPQRMYSLPYRSRAGRRGIIRVMENLGDVEEPLAAVRLALMLLAPLAVLLSAAGGYWLAGRALAPVAHVTRLAREIGPEDLSRRLPAPLVPDEIGGLVDTFNDILGRVEAAFASMKRFTADASHELRGPLARMRGAIDVTLARPRDVSEHERVLAGVGEDVDRLRSLVEDLLVLARADSGSIRLERAPVRLDVLASEVVESLHDAASERKVALRAHCPAPVVVAGDERWLRQLLFDLVDNAIKFAARVERDRAVDVGLEAADGSAALTVTDSGPGFPEEALPHVFERFYRADGARSPRGEDGFGLGLSIAAWIVTAQGGRISAANRPEGGAQLRVTLPLA